MNHGKKWPRVYSGLGHFMPQKPHYTPIKIRPIKITHALRLHVPNPNHRPVYTQGHSVVGGILCPVTSVQRFRHQ